MLKKRLLPLPRPRLYSTRVPEHAFDRKSLHDISDDLFIIESTSRADSDKIMPLENTATHNSDLPTL